MITKQFIAVSILVFVLVSGLSGCIGEESDDQNKKPNLIVTHPQDRSKVTSLVMISGLASDPDGDKELQLVEVKIGTSTWQPADGITKWSYEWDTYSYDEGVYTIVVRAFDGKAYSDNVTITVEVDHPERVDTDAHKWAIYIATANFPQDNESKLGNGGLFLAEEMAAYLIEQGEYPTSNIFLLFDDGWIRRDNGYGDRYKPLQERPHQYDITYGGATKENVQSCFRRIIEESNRYRDSEIFIWMFNHGYGDENDTLTGGKLFESSQIFLWDDIISDQDVGEWLGPLKSNHVCIIVDACYCGGFADKTIFTLPTSLLFRSGIPQNGRVVIAGTSKFRKGYASTTQGPLFTLLWFDGLQTGNADGYKPGLFDIGRPKLLGIFKNGRVSVEEAFYYARYQLRKNENLKDFSSMEPQINDRYPRRGTILSRGELYLGES